MNHRIEIPGLPPTINHVYIHRGHRKIIKPEGVDYGIQINYLCNLHHDVRIVRTQKIAVAIELYSPNWMTKETKKKPSYPSQKAGDADNRVKFLVDCLQKSLSFNDCQIFELVVQKLDSPTEKTIVEINDL